MVVTKCSLHLECSSHDDCKIKENIEKFFIYWLFLFPINLADVRLINNLLSKRTNSDLIQPVFPRSISVEDSTSAVLA